MPGVDGDAADRVRDRGRDMDGQRVAVRHAEREVSRRHDRPARLAGSLDPLADGHVAGGEVERLLGDEEPRAARRPPRDLLDEIVLVPGAVGALDHCARLVEHERVASVQLGEPHEVGFAHASRARRLRTPEELVHPARRGGAAAGAPERSRRPRSMGSPAAAATAAERAPLRSRRWRGRPVRRRALGTVL